MTLHQDIKNILKEELDNPDYREGWIDDLEQHGCVSGMVSGLVYYKDTEKFFDDNEKEILDLVKEYEFTTDPIEEGILGFKNKMAWFAFEVLARSVFKDMDFNDDNDKEEAA